MAVKGDLIADLTEDLAAEQKARVTYDNILRLSDDPDVNDVIKFLRAREIVHFQRFGEGLRLAKEKMDQKNLYFVNPSFDQQSPAKRRQNQNTPCRAAQCAARQGVLSIVHYSIMGMLFWPNSFSKRRSCRGVIRSRYCINSFFTWRVSPFPR